MSGTIFFGCDKDTQDGLESGLNGFYYDAFELLIDAALLESHNEIYNVISGDEAKAFNYFYFSRLS
jgi:hypothetical protein